MKGGGKSRWEETMSESYPELERRVLMLASIHGWAENRTNANQNLKYDEIIGMDQEGGSVLGADPSEYGSREEFDRATASSINLFRTLLAEGYINGRLIGEGSKTGPPFIEASITGLTDKGLKEIGALPDPNQRLINGFQEAIREIQQDPNLSEEEKERQINWAKQAINFVSAVGADMAVRILAGGL